MTTTRTSAWIRRNALGLAAIFIALSGTAYATHPGGANTISSGDIINGEVRSGDIGDGEVKGADVAADSLGGGKIAGRSVKNADLGLGASSSNTIADGGVRGIDVGNETLTGAHVADGSLTGDDVDESSLNLAAEGWHEVGAPGEPSFNNTAHCTWTNFNSFHNSAAFLRDRHGFVHLKGLVDADDVPGQVCGFGFADDARIFTLPVGYRPARREVHLSLTTNGFIARINVDAPAGGFIQPPGAVSISPPTSIDGAKQALSLDGISFRCAPSGANGCP